MSQDELPELVNEVRARRVGRGWSQEDLARRSGLSRAGVSAIEMGRLVPSTAAALSLAGALECRVEDLFRLRGAGGRGPSWAWPAPSDPARYWAAEVGGELKLYPVEASPLGVIPHDGLSRSGALLGGEVSDPRRTLVLACCDPAAGLLAAEMERSAGVRLIALQRSSLAALDLLKAGLVHAAGVHLGGSDRPESNAETVRVAIGDGYMLLRVAAWDEGIALASGRGRTTARSAVADLRWVGREEGSGARQCQDELLAGRKPPRRLASGHRGVAEAVRHGWAEAGVCLRLATEEAGLDFLGVRREAYDLCFPSRWADDPRLRALVEAVRSHRYRRALGELPGYDSAVAGELIGPS